MAQESISQDLDKLIEAALYISERSADDPDFEMTKLVKFLHYADCSACIQREKLIADATYLHFPYGPYLEDWHLARKRLELSGDATVLRRSRGANYHRYQLLANRSANRELLSPEEFLRLDGPVESFVGFSAVAIKRYSHQEIAWRATEDGEMMDYELVGITAPRPSQNSIRRGQKIADAIGPR